MIDPGAGGNYYGNYPITLIVISQVIDPYL